jgi:hypothetical protein
MEHKGEIAIYRGGSGRVEITVKLENDTVWLSQKQIADMFVTQRPAITKHLNNIFKEGELDEKAVCSILEHTASDGKTYSTKYYNLDAVISVGYRVNSKRATQFRIWATNILKAHITKGYTLNKDRMQELENLYHYLKDTMTITTMNINRLRIDSPRKKDITALAERIDKIKHELDSIKKKAK